ncbi:MAG TPA: hypothetical protein VN908_08580 [Gemmatimonadales bacterium]|nr:hypothetical protein [Gemmatimonadales bacterium]
MTSMLMALGALSTPLAAQSPPRSAISFGFAATLGGGWQIEGGEIGYVRRVGNGLVGALSVGARVGTFIDERAILGGSRGIVFAPTLAARTGTVSLAQLGDEQNATAIGFDVTLEASGYLASNSPLPQGGRWAAVALLPGLRVGSGDGPRYGFVIGPTLFLGSSKSTLRGLLAIRVEAPLARREHRP